MNRSVATARGAFAKGDEIEVPDKLGASWVESGTAEDLTPKSSKKKAAADEPSGDA